MILEPKRTNVPKSYSLNKLALDIKPNETEMFREKKLGIAVMRQLS